MAINIRFGARFYEMREKIPASVQEAGAAGKLMTYPKKTNGREARLFSRRLFLFSLGHKLVVEVLIGRDYLVILKLLSCYPRIVVVLV